MKLRPFLVGVVPLIASLSGALKHSPFGNLVIRDLKYKQEHDTGMKLSEIDCVITRLEPQCWAPSTRPVPSPRGVSPSAFIVTAR